MAGAIWMDIWSWDEIAACHARLHQALAPSIVIERYTCFGGSVRYVLGKPEYSFEKDLKPLVSSAEVDPLMRLDLAGLNDDISHKLVHIRVRLMRFGQVQDLSCFNVISGKVIVQ